MHYDLSLDQNGAASHNEILADSDDEMKDLTDIRIGRKGGRYSLKRPTKKYVLGNPYLIKLQNLKRTMPEWDNFFSDEAREERASNWVRLDVVGQALSMKYAWAVPDNRALKILEAFSPLVEIGGGSGYWCRLLRERGVDILSFDRKVNPRTWWTYVGQGGPNMLENRRVAANRNLFLCYPDDSNPLSIKCLERFTGEYIIHVGELISTGTLSGYPQAPFGRTSCSEFSVMLQEHFHCLLVADLPRLPFSKDCISVWKRTKWVPGKSIELEGQHEGALAICDKICDRGESGSRLSSERSTESQSLSHSRGDSLEPDEDAHNLQHNSRHRLLDRAASNSNDRSVWEEDDGESEESSLGGDFWANIPPDEILPSERAAPCLQYLLATTR